jgi:hydrogenase-1 operon protein HyaF
MTTQFRQLNIPVSVIGPGSQADEGDLELDYLPMPKDMHVFHAPSLMDEHLENYPQAAEVLLKLQHQLESITDIRQLPEAIELDHLSADDLNFVNRFLGEGEVLAIVTTPSGVDEIQETVLAGVWRSTAKSDGQRHERLEVGYLPRSVIEKTFSQAVSELELTQDFPAGVINAPSLLSELSAGAATYRTGDEANIINLSLLPQTPEDLLYLTQCLGVGETVVLSRGYGACRVTATHLKSVWWVQYLNSDDRLILNSVEVVDFPIVIQAAIEDLEDSAMRIREMMESV